jgi:hypothetical protein
MKIIDFTGLDVLNLGRFKSPENILNKSNDDEWNGNHIALAERHHD